MQDFILDDIIAYEQGELSEENTLKLFQKLHDTKIGYKLQGHYGRTLIYLLNRGLIHDTGTD